MPILPGQVLGTVRMAVRVRVGVRVMARARASPPPLNIVFEILKYFLFILNYILLIFYYYYYLVKYKIL